MSHCPQFAHGFKCAVSREEHEAHPERAHRTRPDWRPGPEANVSWVWLDGEEPIEWIEPGLGNT